MQINANLAGAYLDSIRKLSQELGISGEVGIDTILTLPEVVSVRGPDIDAEALRETSAMGSKAQDAYITLEAVNIKEELENLREQVQNLE